MKPILSATALCAALSVATTTQAQGVGDWYVSVFAGYTNIESIDTEQSIFEIEHEFDDSGIFGVTVGRSVQPGLRAELELSYASYEGGEVIYDGEVAYSFTQGEASTTYLMGNVWYDVTTARLGGAVPYLGGGIGVVNLDVDTTLETFDAGYGDTITAFAYQLGAGVMFPVGAGMIDVAYRLKGANDLDIDDNDGIGVYEGGALLSNSLQVGYVTRF